MQEAPNRELVVVLNNVRSVHNVGSIFRTADGFGVSQVCVVGHTPGPVDRFGRERRDFSKVSLGAENTVPYAHYETFEACTEALRAEQYTLVAVEQARDAEDISHHEFSHKTALVFGAEVEGLSDEVVRVCDAVVEIPMIGEKESFNVSVAVGVVLYAARFQ